MAKMSGRMRMKAAPEKCRPLVGKFISVTVDWSQFMKDMKGAPANQPRTNTIFGEVLPSEDFDQENSFRITTGNRFYPVAIVPMRFVSDITQITKSLLDARPAQDKCATWQVQSSSKKTEFYTVTRNHDFWHCNCLGYVFSKSKRNCGHIRIVQTMKPM